MEWKRTKAAALELQSLLKCGICNGMLQRPCTLGRCEHFFCSDCIQPFLGCPCPTCGVPSHKKDMQLSRQLLAVTASCQEILSLLSACSLSESFSTDSESGIIEDSPAATRRLPAISTSGKTDKTQWDFNEQAGKREHATEAENKQDVQGEAGEAETSEKRKKLGVRKVLLQNHLPQPESENQFPIYLPGRAKRARFSGKKKKVVNAAVGRKVTRQLKQKTIMSKASPTSTAMAARDIQSNVEMCESRPSTTSEGHRSESEEDILSICEPSKRKSSAFTTCSNVDVSPKCVAMETSAETPVPACNASSISAEQKYVPSCSSSKPNKMEMVTPTRRIGSAKRNSTGRAKRASIKSPAGLQNIGVSPQMLKRNAKGETALHLAAIKCDEVNVKTILETGFNPDVKDNAGWTPLHEACNRGFVGIATLLLDHGATIDMPGGDNETALHDAVYNGRVECARLLVSRGASVSARDRHGKTPHDIAYTEIMKEALKAPLGEIVLDRKAEMVLNKSCHLTNLDSTSEKVVIMISGLERTDKQHIKQWVRELGWTIRDTYSYQVTHLVISVNPAGTCRRTIKFLQAVVSGLWVVDFTWAVECHKRNEKVPEEKFEVKGTTGSPGSLTPKRSRMNHEKQLPGLFDGCHFYFIGEFGPPPIPTRDELVQLVRLGGGFVHSREPKLEAFNPLEITVPYHVGPKSTLANCSFFMVNCSVKEMYFCNKERTMCRVPHSWILACIAEFRILEELPES